MANPTLQLGVPKQGSLVVAKVMKNDKMVIVGQKSGARDDQQVYVHEPDKVA